MSIYCNKLLQFSFFLSCILFLNNGFAAEIVAEIGINGGGEDVFIITDFKSNEDSKLSAGGGLSLLAGGEFDIVDDIKLRAAVGFVTQSLTGIEIFTGSEFEITWTHNPINVLVFKQFKKFNLGAGLTYHLNPELKATGILSGRSREYDNALGWITEADFRISDRYFVGLRYTAITYKPLGGGYTAADREYDGNSLALVFAIVI